MKRGYMILLILVSVLLIIGGLFGLFKGDEVQQAPVQADVSVANAPCTIQAVYDVVDTEGGGTGNTIIPLDGLNLENPTTMQVVFLARDPNGIGDLPGSAGNPFDLIVDGETLGTNGNVEVYVTSPASVRTVTDVYSASCVRDATCTISQEGGGCANKEMEYRCSLDIEFYYEPGTWSVFVGIADVDVPPNTDTDNSKTFTIDTVTEFDYPSSFGWTTSEIVLTATDQTDPNSEIGFTNYGNTDYNTMTITTYDLPPSEGADDAMPVNAFSVSDADGTQCSNGGTADVLSDSSPVVLTAGGTFYLPYGDGINGDQPPTVDLETLHFCIWDQLDLRPITLSDTSYSTAAAGGTIWQVTPS